jgi:protein SCO1/2
MSSKSKIPKSFLAALLCAGMVPSIAHSHIPTPPKHPGEIGRRVVKTAVPNFKLVDQNGKPFQFTAARGKVVLVTFIFTACPDVCPLFTAKFAAIQRALDETRFQDYWLLSITTDPVRDDVATLKDYAQRFKADLARWSFLTGTTSDLAKAWKAFGVNVTRTESGQVFHTALTTLIDRHGIRRVDYYGDRWQEKELLKDIRWLGAQK